MYVKIMSELYQNCMTFVEFFRRGEGILKNAPVKAICSFQQTYEYVQFLL